MENIFFPILLIFIVRQGSSYGPLSQNPPASETNILSYSSNSNDYGVVKSHLPSSPSPQSSPDSTLVSGNYWWQNEQSPFVSGPTLEVHINSDSGSKISSADGITRVIYESNPFLNHPFDKNSLLYTTSGELSLSTTASPVTGEYSKPEIIQVPSNSIAPSVSPVYQEGQNITPYPGCPAALKCVPENYCTLGGIASDSPVELTNEFLLSRVPLTDCLDVPTGIIGKCCRDPNYKDPWPEDLQHEHLHEHEHTDTNIIPIDQHSRPSAGYPIVSSTENVIPISAFKPSTLASNYVGDYGGIPVSSNNQLNPVPPYQSSQSSYFPPQTPSTTKKPPTTYVPPQSSFPSKPITGSQQPPYPSASYPNYGPSYKPPVISQQPFQPPYITGSQNPITGYPVPSQPPFQPPQVPSQPHYKPSVQLPSQPPYQPTYQPPPQIPSQPPYQPSQLPSQSPYQPSQLPSQPPYQPSQLPSQPPFQPLPQVPPQSQYKPPFQPAPQIPPQPPYNPYNPPNQSPQVSYPSSPSQPSYPVTLPPPSSPALVPSTPPYHTLPPAKPSYPPVNQPPFSETPIQSQPSYPTLPSSSPNFSQPLYPQPSKPPQSPYAPSYPQQSTYPLQPAYPQYPQQSFYPQISQKPGYPSQQQESGYPAVSEQYGPYPAQSGYPLESLQQRPYSAEEKDSSPPTIVKQFSATCGIKRNDGTAFGEAPWHAIVYSNKNKDLICAGAIVSENAVLTTAHCLDHSEAETTEIKIGPEGTNYKVAAIARHPQYDQVSLSRDLALVVLKQPIHFDQYVDKICLPTSFTQLNSYSRDCHVSTLAKEFEPKTLQKIPVQVFTYKDCEVKLRNTYLGKYFILNDSFSCVATPAESELCLVKTGSPIACDKGDGTYELFGIKSWDLGCQEYKKSAIFANSDVIWVQSVLASPVAKLISEEKSLRKEKFKGETLENVNINEKPGFGLGYGK